MKKLISFILFLSLLLALCACGGTAEQGSAPPESLEPETSAPAETVEPTLEPTPEPEPEPEFQSVNIGDVIDLDFVEITIGDIGSGEKMTEGNTSYLPANDSNQFFWLQVVLMNKAGQAFQLWGNMPVEIVFDDTYTYEGDVRNFGSFDMAPLVQNNIYLYAEVPPTLLDSYQTVTIRFGFNDEFAEYDWVANNYEKSLENYDNLYEFTYSKDGATVADTSATTIG